MKTLNRVQLLGNVAGDVESKEVSGGLTITNLSLATESRWKDKTTGEWQSQTEYHRCVMFGKLAETADEYVNKGMQLYLEGRLQTRSWEKDGIKRYTTEIKVDDFQMLGARQSDRTAPAAPREPEATPAKDFHDDEIPF